MKINTYSTVGEFLQEHSVELIKNETVNQLFLANLIGCEDRQAEGNFIFGSITDEGQTILLFMNAEPFNLLLSTPTTDFDEVAVQLLVGFLLERQIKIRGINASKKLCERFITDFTQRTGHCFNLHLSMDIMELTQLTKHNSSAGLCRNAKLEDHPLLVEWNLKFAEEATHEKGDRQAISDKLLQKIAAGTLFVVENSEHRVVSMAAVSRELINGICIGPVYTDECERGKGYGKTIMIGISEWALQQGVRFCSLFVDKTNPISNRVYRSIGYQVVSDQCDYRIINDIEQV